MLAIMFTAVHFERMWNSSRRPNANRVLPHANLLKPNGELIIDLKKRPERWT